MTLFIVLSFQFMKRGEGHTENICLHHRNLLTHTLKFLYFLKNWNLELKIRTMFPSNAWLF